MSHIDLANIYGPKVAALFIPGRVCALGPGKPNRALREPLAALTAADLAPGRLIADDDMARCCLAGLWLYHDFLDESHRISQEIETTTGSYWHGIIHRREEDFDNAKYWFRRVGRHPIFDTLHNVTQAMLSKFEPAIFKEFTHLATWNPCHLIDLCQSVRPNSEAAVWLQSIADYEWSVLFDYSYRSAFGENWDTVIPMSRPE